MSPLRLRVDGDIVCDVWCNGCLVIALWLIDRRDLARFVGFQSEGRRNSVAVHAVRFPHYRQRPP